MASIAVMVKARNLQNESSIFAGSNPMSSNHFINSLFSSFKAFHVIFQKKL